MPPSLTLGLGNEYFCRPQPSKRQKSVSCMQPKLYPSIEPNSPSGISFYYFLLCLLDFFVADMEPKVEVIVSEQLTTGDSSISPGDANTPAKGELCPPVPDENAAIGGAPKDYKAEMQHLMGSQIDQTESSPDIGM